MTTVKIGLKKHGGVNTESKATWLSPGVEFRDKCCHLSPFTDRVSE